MRISSGIHQKTGSLQIRSENISCRHRREDTFHGYSHVAGVEIWACHQIDLYQVLVQNYQFLQSDEDSRCRLENKQESSNVQEF
jgi:hypothetical protein